MQVSNVNFINSNDVNIPGLNITLLIIQRNSSTNAAVLPEKLTIPIQQFLEPSNNYSLLYHVCMYMHKSVDNNTILSEQQYTMDIDPILYAVVCDIEKKYDTIFMHVRNIALTQKQKQNVPIAPITTPTSTSSAYTNKVCPPILPRIGPICVTPAAKPAFPVNIPAVAHNNNFCLFPSFAVCNPPQLVIAQRTFPFTGIEHNRNFPEQFWF